MKSRTLTYMVATTTLAALAAPMGLIAQDNPGQDNKQTRYSVTNLGTLGGTLSTALGINNKGWVTGAANLAGDHHEHAFLWYQGVMHDLGTAGGPNSVSGFPLKDDRGLIPGISQTPASDPLGENWAFHCDLTNTVPCDGTNRINVGLLWYNGGNATMPTLGGNNSQAWGANNAGQVVGVAETANQDPNCIAPQVLDYEAIIWTPSENRIEALPAYPGDTISGAVGINDKGQAVGASGACAPISPSIGAHALLWQNGTYTYLGSLGGQLSNVPYAINNKGQIVGVSDLVGDLTGHAFLWQNGTMTDLGTLPGDFFSVAFSINNKGQVVGESCDQNFNCRAFVWRKGVMADLNTLIPWNSSLYLLSANDINDGGAIVGQAYDPSTGGARAFLVTPVGDDSSQEGDIHLTPGGNGQIPKVVLPDNIREQLRQRKDFGRFSARYPV